MTAMSDELITVSRLMEKELGRPLRPEDMAHYLGLDEKTIRLYYRELGGIRLGRRFLFFEKEVLNAIQKRAEVDRPGENKWDEEGKSLPEQEGGIKLGERKPSKSRADLAKEDKHDILV